MTLFSLHPLYSHKWTWVHTHTNRHTLIFYMQLFHHRSRASCEVGFAAGSGRPSSRTTFVRPTPKAWGRGTRWCLACWRPRLNMSSNSTYWSTTSCGRSAWLPAPRSRPSPTMMSAASSLTGGWWWDRWWKWCDSELQRVMNSCSWLPFCLFVFY